ncbi:MAG: SDR family NAD(P)-dependent oxidoreductase [Pseudomonadota bacterium]
MRAAIIGASGGIGGAFVNALAARDDVTEVLALSRSGTAFDSPKITPGHIDIIHENSVLEASQQAGELDWVIVASGILSDGEALKPEKSWRDLNMDAFERVFRINTFGPALVAKHFLPLLPRKRRAVFASLSARVGSISDNGLGGWHAYRASKTALNMLIKNLSIELGRRNAEAICVGLHPGTVATDLSAKFSGGVNHEIFTPDQSASYLIDVLDDLSADQTGKVFDWKGEEIPA